MTSWEIARYFIDCKKDIDSIMFISENVRKISNLNLKSILDSRLRDYYIKIRVVYDKSIKKSTQKELCKTDQILERTLHEADKNYAHKDDDYVPTELEFRELIDTLKERLEHCKTLCKDSLPDIITIDYVPYDRDLYRFMNCITPEKEEELQYKLFPNYKRTFEEVMGPMLKHFKDVEDIKTINNPGHYGVIMECGLNAYEGLQNRQDACIRMNVLFGENCWCSLKK